MDHVSQDAMLFFDQHPKAYPLYEAFYEELMSRFPETKMKVQKSQISFYNRHLFACVSFLRVKKKADLPERYFVLTLSLSEPLASDRAAVKTEPYSIVFNSLTGNTKKLADTIYAVFPKENCDYFGVPKEGELYSGMLYIGFWTDKGNADKSTLTLLSTLKNKKIFLFGTAGFGGSEAYFQKILNHVKQSIDSSNSVVGEYMCQGKMPPSVREYYMKMKAQPEHPENIDALIENFDQALSHPDRTDLERLRKSIV